MIKVVVGGAAGRLGTMMCSLVREQPDMTLYGAIESKESKSLGMEIAPGVRIAASEELATALQGADVYVDFTIAEAASRNMVEAARAGANVVVGTTGIQQDAIDRFMDTVRQKNTSAVLSPNFSVGVNVFWKICEQMARHLEGYDVEIIEVHHNKKKDAPSGTAKKAAEIVAEASGIDKFVFGREGLVGMRGREIGIHAVRAGDVVGDHTIIFAGKKERLELTHRAHSRESFAEGCITAIRWVASKKDGKVHSMSEVLGL